MSIIIHRHRTSILQQKVFDVSDQATQSAILLVDVWLSAWSSAIRPLLRHADTEVILGDSDS